MSSQGAGIAAPRGGGKRSTEMFSQDYQIVLPTLPSGSTVKDTVFLHADLKARLYRVEYFRDALEQLSLLPEVVALGAYQMNHVWAVTFCDNEEKEKMLAAGNFTVKDRRCVVVDPCNQALRIKLHWLLHGVPDEDVRTALAPFGKVLEVTRDKWRVQGCNEKNTTTRSVTLQLKVGVTTEDLPHQLRVAEGLALVSVPGRAPLCLGCYGIRHMRRDCRVPRCGHCRRYGHDQTMCVRSYASVAGPPRSYDTSEHIMDLNDAKEATREDKHEDSAVATVETKPPGKKDTNTKDTNEDERWRVDGVSDKGSTTRAVLLQLKTGLKVDDLPHQIRVAGELWSPQVALCSVSAARVLATLDENVRFPVAPGAGFSATSTRTVHALTQQPRVRRRTSP
ncbi:uncharacterized protein LOC119446123 [Dermacentor silvarum]|uniref:uncharacterized protein LOC119446123 n=1 Tax=Dermacentor silvarum TaxID=543639 RepID=UPI00189A7691|nr:uncharacterized protein LOC119446123 [Dermacentor silvarum]